MHNKTLREIYEYDLIPDDGLDYPVEEWFNAVMEKTEDKLTVADVSRMLRQKIFSVVAINRAIEMLKDDIFTGEMYEGQLMANLCNAKEKYLCKRYDDIRPLLKDAELKALSHNWSVEKDKAEFLKVVEDFIEKIG
ncbi:MAG: hypothetical protein IKS13_08395 [Ruminococcus sp.]|nr:hypothetical protein [Ruminococcus sp.]